jgi:hypothetical protein
MKTLQNITRVGCQIWPRNELGMSIYFTFEVDFLPKRDVDPPLGLLGSMHV